MEVRSRAEAQAQLGVSKGGLQNLIKRGVLREVRAKGKPLGVAWEDVLLEAARRGELPILGQAKAGERVSLGGQEYQLESLLGPALEFAPLELITYVRHAYKPQRYPKAPPACDQMINGETFHLMNALHDRKIFRKGAVQIVTVATPIDTTQTRVVYRVLSDAVPVREPGQYFCPFCQVDAAKAQQLHFFYELERLTVLERGICDVVWGKGLRSWYQRAANVGDKLVLEPILN